MVQVGTYRFAAYQHTDFSAGGAGPHVGPCHSRDSGHGHEAVDHRVTHPIPELCSPEVSARWAGPCSRGIRDARPIATEPGTAVAPRWPLSSNGCPSARV